MAEATPAPNEEKSLVVKNAIGEYIRAKELKVSSDLWDSLNAAIKALLDRACTRCTENSRKTVMAQDI